jgi:hypothetical protein
MTPREFAKSQRQWLREHRIAHARYMLAMTYVRMDSDVDIDAERARTWWRSVLDEYGANGYG